MTVQNKVVQFDLFIKEQAEVEKVVIEAKKRNFSRRINHLFGELGKIKIELKESGLWEEEKPLGNDTKG